jgi:hypothetical protein
VSTVEITKQAPSFRAAESPDMGELESLTRVHDALGQVTYSSTTMGNADKTAPYGMAICQFRDCDRLVAIGKTPHLLSHTS